MEDKKIVKLEDEQSEQIAGGVDPIFKPDVPIFKPDVPNFHIIFFCFNFSKTSRV